jgi:uncharacterized membrane protein YfcA
MNASVRVLWAALILALALYIGTWLRIERRRRLDGRGEPARPPARAKVPVLLGIGFGANLLDTLGIGSFATTAAAFRLGRLVRDGDLPGTLNAGHTIPVMAEALIFIVAVRVEPTTLISMILAAMVGMRIGAGVVTRLPRRAIQCGMGAALLIAAAVILGRVLGLFPGGGQLLGLSGATLAVAIAGNCLFGALMALGIGLYAPCLVLVSLLGLNPLAAFPVMMGSSAFLMPIGSVLFIRKRKYDLRAALGLALGGVPGVLIGAFIIRSLSLRVLNWLVLVIVLYTAATLLAAAARSTRAATDG